jgi:16S rRNA (cytosine967-C5)-methyltransferase
MNSRALAAKTLTAVLYQSTSLSQALPQQLATQPSLRDPQLVQAICYGVLRHYYQLEAILKQLMSKPLKNKDADLELLLIVGIYQLLFLSVPQHVVLNETVNAAKQLGKSWATGLVNGILRQYLRDQLNLSSPRSISLEEEYNHPQWIIKAIQNAWPTQWQTILVANQVHPPMALRVNKQRISRAEYQTLLQEKAIESSVSPIVDSAITLTSPIPVEQLPFFKEGYISVQDSASQIAATLLDCPIDAYVLDACAAPGGKTCHILERYPTIKELVAVDIDAERLSKVKENLGRLKLKATLKTGDACQPNKWWNGQLFDRILCDAPCSATGVIRRHPDIKYLREETDLQSLPTQQLAILTALWPLLKTDGKLIYSTCSILPQENSYVIERFLQQEPTAQIESLNTEWGISQPFGCQILPGENGMDGFYYAVLRKIA